MAPAAGQAVQDDEPRTLTIYAAECPAGYGGDASADECDDNPMPGVPFRVGRPFTEAFTDFTPTDGEGLVSFGFNGMPLDGTLRVIEQLPAGTGRFVAYCIDELGNPLGIVYANYAESNPSIGVADVAVGEADDVLCDWYNVPAIAPAEVGGEAPEVAEGNAASVLFVEDEATYRGGPDRTGQQPGPGPTGVPLPVEGYPPEENTGSSAPVALGGTVFVGGSRWYPGVPDSLGRHYPGLFALNGATGAVRWFVVSTAGGAVVSPPAISAGTAYTLTYIGSDFSFLQAIDIATGSERWKVSIEGASASSPVVADGSIYVGGSDGAVHSLDSATGADQWRLKLAEWELTEPAAAEGMVYVGSFDGALYAVDAATGAPRWRFETDGGLRFGPAVAGSTVYIPTENAVLHAVDTESGVERWRVDLAAGTGRSSNQPATAPSVVDGVVYIAAQGALSALDAASGQELWCFQADGSALSTPSVADGGVFAVSGRGNLYAVDAETGQQRWRFAVPVSAEGPVVAPPAPAVTGGVVYFTTSDSRLFAVMGSDGRE